MNRSYTFLFAIALIVLAEVACHRNNLTPTPGQGADSTAASGSKSITSFVLKAADNPNLKADISANIVSDSIKLTFEQGTNLSSLVPAIAFTGKAISPASETAENFDSALVYKVTAQDGSTMTYHIVVSIISSNKNITGFTFRVADNSPNLKADVAATIGSATIGTDTITATVPNGTQVTALVPYITTTGKGVSPSSGTAQDFAQPVKYTVTAVDGTTKTYLVVVTIAPSPVSGTIFVAGATPELNPNSTGGFYAIDAATGKIKWSYLENNFFNAEPTAAGGLVYELDEGGNMLAFDKNTGAINWSTPIGHLYNDNSNAIVVNGALYVGSSDSSLYSINASTGTVNWKINTVVNPGSPTVVGGVVYFAADRLYAVNAGNGAVLWSVYPPVGTDEIFPGNPAVANGIVYFGSTDRNLYALDAATGTVLWKFNLGDVVDGSPTVANGIVYILGGVGDVYALDAATGARKWSYYDPVALTTSPIVANGMLYFTSAANSYVFALDANTGAVKWTYQLQSEPLYSPLWFNGAIFVTDVDRLTSLNATTGTLNWTTSTTGYWLTNPIGIDTLGNVYQTADAGSQN
jgi:outer membrane protein assembly factor BamB